MRTCLTIFTILFAALCISAQTQLRIGQQAPSFSLTSSTGQQFGTEAGKGKVVMVTFWGTTCAICRSEIPHLNELARSFDRTKIDFLAVTMEDEGRVAKYLRTNPFDFNILPNGLGVLIAYADRDRQGGIDMSYPAYYLIDKQGKIAYRGNGWDKIPEITAKLRDLSSRCLVRPPQIPGC